MIALFILWLYIFFLCFSIGVGVVSLFEKFKLFNLKLQDDIPLDYFLLIGFAVVTTFLGYFSFFFRIGREANIILFLLSLTVWIAKLGSFRQIIKHNYAAFNKNFSLWG